MDSPPRPGRGRPGRADRHGNLAALQQPPHRQGGLRLRIEVPGGPIEGGRKRPFEAIPASPRLGRSGAGAERRPMAPYLATVAIADLQLRKGRVGRIPYWLAVEPRWLRAGNLPSPRRSRDRGSARRDSLRRRAARPLSLRGRRDDDRRRRKLCARDPDAPDLPCAANPRPAGPRVPTSGSGTRSLPQLGRHLAQRRLRDLRPVGLPGAPRRPQRQDDLPPPDHEARGLADLAAATGDRDRRPTSLRPLSTCAAR